MTVAKRQGYEKAKDWNKVFESHGVELSNGQGDNLTGPCPFCLDKPHSHRDYGLLCVEPTTGQWDCKSCGASGNIYGFLKSYYELRLKETTDDQREELARIRKIPVEQFAEVAKDGSRWLFPGRNRNGSFANLYYKDMDRPDVGVQSSPCCQHHIFGEETLSDWTPEKGPIYVCEGPWDRLALQWLLQQTKSPGLVLALPGATVFKKEWLEWFTGHNVVLLLDNDTAGIDNMKKHATALLKMAASVQTIVWPEKLAKGYDINDHVREYKRSGKKAFDTLLSYVKPVKPGDGPTDSSGENPQPQRKLKPVTYEKCKQVWRKHLYLPDPNLMDVVLGSVAGNRLEGNPLWLFLVGNSGDGKTEVLKTIEEHSDVYRVSGLSPKALVSGYVTNNEDPSLLPHLDNKLVTLLDFTSILSDTKESQQAIYGVLRLAYDGAAYKDFGTGERKDRKKYSVKFNVIAGVTNAVERYADLNRELGERFIRYRVATGDEEEKIRRANINNANLTAIRQELRDATLGFLQTLPNIRPTVPDNIMRAIVRLAKFTAWGRSFVPRDRDSGVQGNPQIETGTRLSTELVRFGLGIALVQGRGKLTWGEYQLICKAAVDSLPSMRGEIVQALLKMRRKADAPVTAKEMADKLRRPLKSVERHVEDLFTLNVVDRQKITVGTKHEIRFQLVPDYSEVLLLGSKRRIK